MRSKMNKGYAFYLGERVYFSEVLVNVWSGEAEYLIAWGSEPRWVKQHELSLIVYLVA